MTPTTYDCDSALFSVYNNYVIVEPKPSSQIGQSTAIQLQQIVGEHFSGNFGVISNRIHGISIDPMVYLKAKEKMPQFMALGIVMHKTLTRIHFESEKKFIKAANIQFDWFTNLDKAINWMETFKL